MHAYYIVGADEEDRKNKVKNLLTDWSVAAPDQITIYDEEEHIGIGAVREFQKRLMLTPFQSDRTVGVIMHAERLTTEAQNALLKLLEEPPPHAYIILAGQTVDAVLPTIISRCEVMLITEKMNDATREEAKIITDLFNYTVVQKLSYVDTVADDRLKAKNWTYNTIKTGSQLLLKSTTPGERLRYSKLLRLLTTALRQLEVNVNPRLVLDCALLDL
ncbi:MAG TPA: hypothetical protein VMR81_00315 [Patescibacteria group bacterium]|nr:hypothetical protein [Patescibacteria group bacterium]